MWYMGELECGVVLGDPHRVGEESMGRRKSEERRAERSYGILPFVLEEVDGEGAVTPQAGLLTVAEAARGMGLPAVVEREVQVKERERGYSEWETIESYVLLIAGGGGVPGRPGGAGDGPCAGEVAGAQESLAERGEEVPVCVPR